MKDCEQSVRNFVLLRGRMENFQRTRRSHDFVLSQLAQRGVGATALASAAMGSGGASIGLINMAMNSDEEADWVEFELDGKSIRGWMWLMPMRKGDEVEVVAELLPDGRYMAYSVQRVSDSLVAICPHVFCGRKPYQRLIAKYLFWLYLFAFCFLAIGGVKASGEGLDGGMVAMFLFWMFIGGAGMFALIFLRVRKKAMRFYCLAEDIFRTFGWENVESIDLRATSKENRKENRSPNFGRYYFRYK
ncbi:putative type VI secretion system effector [Caballeronia sp. ATUFL_F1_KS4A]|uniref:putative type VI secretion system effector n=1 Tax=Caballeronia sp. ATUFL_F1_KS4A TaxID=2921768 RepID=UPI0020293755|nr:putative type VI secretion system effector [Caballeronia sp. ATUFL_F1_KS4A]